MPTRPSRLLTTFACLPALAVLHACTSTPGTATTDRKSVV